MQAIVGILGLVVQILDPVGNLCAPCVVPGLLDIGQNARQEGTCIGDQIIVCRHVLVNLGCIDVDVDDACIGCKAVGVGCNAIGEACADGQ